ncbi:phosphopentomutase [Alteribacillus persepolensis]|uniref:Phosphopentomutase n=1 Tax=Alteribacillus persepolensis TaxID=568899 RepID=A0A1G7ZPG7_9BACI|nr:phosphopentomutase [Alteribacillus persepolensis]SDH10467.1 phosphopentomutase [Alteribacillus persepolensis]
MPDYPFKRMFIIVMDSVGIGEAPDAEEYGDKGADTLGHIAEEMNGLTMPNMEKLGLGNIKRAKGIHPAERPSAHTGVMQEASHSKDTMTGHWEIMGLHIKEPFRTFPNGFPDELITKLEEAAGRSVIGNKVASGTEIIKELGPQHMETGDIIVYTSADSVLQIAAHEDVVPVEELYDICKKAREMTYEAPYMIGRVIARPFIGEPGAFERTANRHDYALKPFGRTVMNNIQDAGLDSISIGKISDIYDGEGITESLRTSSNDDGMDKIVQTARKHFTGTCFLNLVDFDAKFGHRRDPIGYGKALEAFDERLPELLQELTDDDALIITADHGNDPVHHGTDHTRELVPLFVYTPRYQPGSDLGKRQTFADIGATVADNFSVNLPDNGISFLKDIIKEG